MTIARPLALPIARPLNARALGGGGAAPAPVYATWNPDDKDASVVLSGGDLVASRPSGAGWSSVRATVGLTAAKWRWQKVNGSGAHIIVGVATADAPLNDYPGADANGWGFYVGGGGLYTTHGGATVSIGTMSQASALEFRLNLDANEFSLVHSGSVLHTFDISSRGVSALFPIQGLFGAGASAEANFGPDGLGTPVAGYNDGVYQ